ncbi:hypothetical protein PsYK624_053620 [Phanerochaete sordida]|uniref:Uncharacterized protein n=1 Tax=Phanerochaete sordida TaxID=48140 RepID=A0A9P3G884_9APHY|nr:hypothetical protein PsYK624_053620 [Phanerochaete sordida]
MILARRFSFFTLVLSAVIHLITALGALVNVTVDDEGSDLTTGERINYEGDWAVGPACVDSIVACEASPDVTQVRDGSWHGTTHNPNIPSQTVPGNATFSFNGTALYAFGVLDGAWDLELTFFLDGQDAGRLSVPQTTSYTYQYNQLLFKAEGLDDTTHFWRMQNGLGNKTTSVALLDYLMYTSLSHYVRSGFVPNFWRIGIDFLPHKSGKRLCNDSEVRHSWCLTGDTYHYHLCRRFYRHHRLRIVGFTLQSMPRTSAARGCEQGL